MVSTLAGARLTVLRTAVKMLMYKTVPLLVLLLSGKAFCNSDMQLQARSLHAAEHAPEPLNVSSTGQLGLFLLLLLLLLLLL